MERPHLNPVPVTSPWYQLGIDFVGPMSPPSLKGNCYIMTVSDYFTKFGFAHALPTKEAVPTVAVLPQARTSNACMLVNISVIITDQGREFHNQFNAELMSVFDSGTAGLKLMPGHT